jgi:hypothetical protein
MKNQSKFLGTKSGYLRQNWSARPFCGITLFVILALSMTACGGGSGGNGIDPGGEIPGGGGGDSNPNPLTVNVWKHGELTATATQVQYSFSVSPGNSYYIWWNDIKQGNNTKSADIKVSAKYSDSTSNLFSDVDSGWSSPRSIYPTANKIVIITVSSYTSGGIGTFSIVYNTGNTKPSGDWAVPANAIPLNADTWAYGTIASSPGLNWYSVAGAETTNTYRLWWDGKTSNFFTGNIAVTGYYSDGTEAFALTESSSWTNPKVITPTKTGTLYISVRVTSSLNVGTYGIVYSTGMTRPALNLSSFLTAEQLQENTWKDATLSGVQWYSIPVTDETAYSLWADTSDRGSGLKTGRIYFYAYYNDGERIFEYNSNTEDLYGVNHYGPPKFTANAATTVFVRVSGYGSTGTYGVAYSTGSSMPAVSYDGIDFTEITLNTWKNDEIDGAYKWYKVSVTAEQEYRVYLNNSSDGDGTKTGNVLIYIYDGNGLVIRGSTNNLWHLQTLPFTPTNNTIYIKVSQYYLGGTGTYALVCTDKTGRPLDLPPDPSITPTGLTVGQWKYGEITTQKKSALYSFTATAGTTYYIWWADKNAPSLSMSNLRCMTGSVYINAYGSDGTPLFEGVQSAYNEQARPQTLTVATGGTVYLLADQKNTSVYGIYGLVVNSSSTLPAFSLNDVATGGTITPETLVSGVWKDGTIISGNTQWYKVTVTSGTVYNFWLNQHSTVGSTEGDGTKTGEVMLDAYYSDGTEAFWTLGSLWGSPKTLTSTKNDTLYINVTPRTSNTTGTYGLVYNTGTGAARPVTTP